MAVVLCREEGKTSPIPFELKKAPRITIKSQPIPSPTRHPTKTTARSDSHYACAEPSREEFWRGAYERRSIQLDHCGFHGEADRPYTELGHVELNDGRLILEGLGQSAGEHKSTHFPYPRHQTQTVTLASPYRVKLRSKTPSQFPTKLVDLKQEVSVGNNKLESIRRGNGLFELTKKHNLEKQRKEDELVSLRKVKEIQEWSEAEVTSSVSLTQAQEELIKSELVLEQEEPEDISAKVDWESQSCDENETEDGGQENAKSPHQDSLNTSRLQERSPDCLSLSGDGIGVDRAERRLSTFEGRAPDSQRKHTADVDIKIERWYRILCVLVWILEAMRLESPFYMTPFHKCWKQDHPVPDGNKGRQVYDTYKASLSQWNKIIYKQQALGRFRSNIHATVFTNRLQSAKNRSQQSTPTVDHVTTPTRDRVTMRDIKDEEEELHGTGHATTRTNSDSTNAGARRSESIKLEEQTMKKQKKLTPIQMEKLLILVEEELNYSKKDSRNRVNALIKEADEARLKSDQKKGVCQLPPIPLDVEAVGREFEELEERRRMIVHEQLTAMERDRSKALHQRFSSLKVSGNLWHDLSVMREGVEIETTSMARKKLLMNYKWFSELQSILPDCVKGTPKCIKLIGILEGISQYMCEVGPKRMSRRRLIQVLATRKPCELCNPDVADAVDFLTQRVIYIVTEDWVKWLEQHTIACQHTMSSYLEKNN